MGSTAPKGIHLVCGGSHHDFDFVRLELLKLLADFRHVRTTVASGYGDQDGMHRADALITYTCDLVPLEPEIDGLQQFLREGGKWFALHGTNAKLRFDHERKVWTTPSPGPRYFELLGSQFKAHPPIQPFRVEPVCAHPLVEGIEAFETTDQLYVLRTIGEYTSLLETTFSGRCKGYSTPQWRKPRRVPVMYLHPWEDNDVLYLSLGHVERSSNASASPGDIGQGSWALPVFHELVRRGILWALNELPQQAQAGNERIRRQA